MRVSHTHHQTSVALEHYENMASPPRGSSKTKVGTGSQDGSPSRPKLSGEPVRVEALC